MTSVRSMVENASISLNELSDHVGGNSCTPTDLLSTIQMKGTVWVIECTLKSVSLTSFYIKSTGDREKDWKM